MSPMATAAASERSRLVRLRNSLTAEARNCPCSWKLRDHTAAHTCGGMGATSFAIG